MSVMTTTEKAGYDALVSGAAQALKKDGSVAATANLPMGTNKLTGLAAGSGAGDSVRFEQVALLSGAQAFTGAQSGVAATAAANFIIRTDLDQAIVVVAGVTTAALPAYTVSGGSAAGSTLTANANGAFPTIDGNVSVTAAATGEAPSARFLLHNGASAVDNGVYVLTQQGDGSHPWIAVRYTGLDTAAKIPGSVVRAALGIQSGGGVYEYKGIAAITMGTTNLFWLRTDANASANERVTLIDDDFLWGVTNSNATASLNNAGLANSVTGAGAASSLLAAGSNTATRMGILSLTMGTTTTGRSSQLQAPGSIFLGTNTGFYLEFKCGVPTLSDGTNTFSFFVGLSDTVTASPTNGVCCSFQPAVSTTDWQFTTANAGTVTNTASGRTIVAGTDDRIVIIKYPGDTNIYFQINGGSLVAVSTNIPTSNPVSLIINALKSAGTTARTFEIDYARGYYFTPTRRAA